MKEQALPNRREERKDQILEDVPGTGVIEIIHTGLV